jgi:hypothetical protein
MSAYDNEVMIRYMRKMKQKTTEQIQKDMTAAFGKYSPTGQIAPVAEQTVSTHAAEADHVMNNTDAVYKLKAAGEVELMRPYIESVKGAASNASLGNDPSERMQRLGTTAHNINVQINGGKAIEGDLAAQIKQTLSHLGRSEMQINEVINDPDKITDMMDTAKRLAEAAATAYQKTGHIGDDSDDLIVDGLYSQYARAERRQLLGSTMKDEAERKSSGGNEAQCNK